MTNFISFDDGLSYINVNQIRYFETEKSNNGGLVTKFHLVDGSVYQSLRPHKEIAEMLGGVNIYY
jgi:hypothetical protein